MSLKVNNAIYCIEIDESVDSGSMKGATLNEDKANDTGSTFVRGAKLTKKTNANVKCCSN